MKEFESVVSRRELLTRYFKKPELGSPGCPNTEPSNPLFSHTVASRRDFLAGSAVLAVATIAGAVACANSSRTGTDVESEVLGTVEAGLSKANELKGRVEREIHNDGQRASYSDTMIQTAGVLAAEVVTAGLIGVASKSLGGTPVEKTETRGKTPSETMAVLIAPPIEEAIFRLLPSEILAGKTGDLVWEIGVPASILFGLCHASGSLSFIKFVDASIGGTWYWYLMRTRGYFHATLAHATRNFLGIELLDFLKGISKHKKPVLNSPDPDQSEQ